MTIQHTGACLCGAIRIAVAGALEYPPEACHCSQCRKQTGHFLAGVNVRKTALKVKGQDQIGWFQSSAAVKRGFCKVCGSTLFWQPIDPAYEWTGVLAGLFDTPIGAPLSKHTFVKDKGDYYQIDDGAPQHDEF